MGWVFFLLRGEVLWLELFLGLPVRYQLDPHEEAETPYVPNDRLAVHHPPELVHHIFSHLCRPVCEVLLIVDIDDGKTGGACKGVAAVGVAVGEALLIKVVSDLLIHYSGPEGDVAGCYPLGVGFNIWNNVPVLTCEHLAGTGKAGHYLVEDHENSGLVADLADLLPVAVRGDHLACPAADGLCHKSGHRFLPLFLDGVPNELGTEEVALRILLLEEAPVTIGRRDMLELLEDAEAGELAVPAAATDAHHRVCGAMVGVPVADYLRGTPIELGNLNGYLVGFGATVSKECFAEITGGDLSELLGELDLGDVRIARGGVGHLIELLLSGLYNLSVVEPDVGIVELGHKIKIFLPFSVPEVPSISMS